MRETQKMKTISYKYCSFSLINDLETMIGIRSENSLEVVVRFVWMGWYKWKKTLIVTIVVANEIDPNVLVLNL